MSAAEKEVAQQIHRNDNQAVVYGRVDRVENHKGIFYHEIILPAASEFDQPCWGVVQSNSQLAQVGQEWRGKCRIIGWPENFTIKSGPNQGQSARKIRTQFKYES